MNNRDQWILISEYLPQMGEVVEVFNEFYGIVKAKRSHFAIPTKNPITRLDEYWFWDVVNMKSVEVILLNEAIQWRPLIKD